MKIRYFGCLIISLLFIFSISSSAEEKRDSVLLIKFKDGSECYALKIDSCKNSNHRILMIDSTKANVACDFILSTTRVPFEEKMKPLENHLDYLSGITFGTPSGLNLLLGTSYGSFRFFIEGMYTFGFDIKGIQFDFAYSFYKIGDLKQYIGAVLGTTFSETRSTIFNIPQKYEYLGVAYSLQYNILFLQLGTAIHGKTVTTETLTYKTTYGFYPVIQLGIVKSF